MNIAIVAPGSVPAIVGGAEKLWWGLTDHINQLTAHRAELIKLASPERNFTELMASYRQFSELDLSRFDQVITTKYPAWMVSHPHHTVYLQHKLRGLYDTYHFTGKPEHMDAGALGRAPGAVQALIRTTGQQGCGRDVLPQFWQQLDEAIAAAPDCFDFPGPLTRRLVHFLDTVALQPQYIQRYFAIANNVATRTGYFPPGVEPVVIYHPSDLPEFRNTGDDYIFTISRLDAPKRVDLLIAAFMQTPGDIELRIAGTGPQASALQLQAASDPRIRFLGGISDAATIAQYAGACFVPFVPYDEDYGLITIEAMQSGKAVLTTTDAGGPNEFVRHGQTGLSVAPTAAALANAMTTLLADRPQTRRMGQRAAALTQGITWRATVSGLLGDGDNDQEGMGDKGEAASSRSPARQKWLVTVTFPVWPPRGGGQSRVYNLYREIAKTHDVTILCFTEPGDAYASTVLAPGLTEVRVPRSAAHHHWQRQLESSLATPLGEAVSVGDIAVIEYFQHSPRYLAELKQLAAEADVVIASHPYTYRALRHVYRGAVWYEAHNVEYDMKAAILPDTDLGRHWLATVRGVEGDCYREAARVLACSASDLQRLQALYGATGAATCVVPNGVVIHTSIALLQARRHHLRQRLGIEKFFSALFMGSWHGPNITAVEWLVANAEQAPRVQFLLVGSVCQHPVCAPLALPPNVHNVGMLDEDQKNLLLAAVDLAINPIISGSGTNLKMLDYAAAGTPIMTTPFGNRGLPFVGGAGVVIAELDDFMRNLRDISQKDLGSDQAFSANSGFDLAATLEWAKLARHFLVNLYE